MSVLRPALVFAAVAMLVPGASPARGDAQIRWHPHIRLQNAYDVVGNRLVTCSDRRIRVCSPSRPRVLEEER